MAATEIPQNQLDQLLAYVLDQRTDNIRELLVRNGYAQANDLSKADLQIVFLGAIKDSEPFRNDVSAYLTGLVQDKALSFVQQPRQTTFNMVEAFKGNWGDAKKPKGSKKLNASGDGFLNDTGPTTPATTATPSSSGSFWSTLGSVVNKDTLTSLFNTGLSAVSTKLQSNATKSSEANALELERIRLQQIQAQAAATAAGGGTKPAGLSTGAIVGIAVGGVAVLGLIIFLATKKK